MINPLTTNKGQFDTAVFRNIIVFATRWNNLEKNCALKHLSKSFQQTRMYEIFIHLGEDTEDIEDIGVDQII